jgi:hypothetical protein
LNEPAANCSLVLIGRYPGKDLPVAQALARVLGRDETWGLRIVSSSPITFFDKLPERHARQIQQALEDVAEAGCRFEVQTGSNASLPRVGWAIPPRIHGRSLAEIAPGSDLQPALPPSPTLNSGMRHAASSAALHATVSIPEDDGDDTGAPAESGNHASATVFVPCPYTGQRIKLSLQLTLSRTDGGTAVNITSTQARVPKPRASGAVILPTATQPRQTGHIQLPRKSGPVPTAETGTAGKVDADKTRGSAQPPAQVWRNTPMEIPLPDVPILPGSVQEQEKADSAANRQPLPLNSQPMDLSTFEAGLGVSPHETVRPFLDPGPHVMEEMPEADEGAGDDSESESALCSVFIERSSSPVVHELVAELHGIPETEAAEMCVAGSVALAENIPMFEANDIKRRCAAINVSARVVRQG